MIAFLCFVAAVACTVTGNFIPAIVFLLFCIFLTKE